MLPSILESRITRTVSAIVVVLAVIALSGCAKKVTSSEAQAVWDTYVNAMHNGDAAAAKACFATETQPFVVLTKKEMDWFNNCKFKLQNSEQTDRYTKLEFEQTVDGKPWPRSIYFVREGDRTVMQYPYILFASNWPVVTSSHFRLHIDPSLVSDKSKQEGYADIVDTMPYERYIALFDSLTGIPIQQPIDYYYAADSTSVRKLLGADKVYWGCLGRAAVSSKEFDFAEISKIPMAANQETIEYVQGMVRAYGEYERARLSPEEYAIRNSRNTLGTILASVTPEMFSQQFATNPATIISWNASGPIMRFSTGMACAIDLLKRHDPHTFCELFDRSNSVDGFKAALSDLYGLTPETWLAELKKEFPVPEQASKN
jgi:hypothetical protein